MMSSGLLDALVRATATSLDPLSPDGRTGHFDTRIMRCGCANAILETRYDQRFLGTHVWHCDERASYSVFIPDTVRANADDPDEAISAWLHAIHALTHSQ